MKDTFKLSGNLAHIEFPIPWQMLTKWGIIIIRFKNVQSNFDPTMYSVFSNPVSPSMM